MNVTLNIGLQVSNNYLPKGAASMELQYKYVKDLLEEHFGKPSCIGIARSATEKTVVAQYNNNVKEVLQELYQLAHDLGQDCIAYAVHTDGVMIGGALVGEYAHEWNYGVFDEAYFIPAETAWQEQWIRVIWNCSLA